MSDKTFYDDLNIEILISTMNRTSLSFLKSMFPNNDLCKFRILIINQTEVGNELYSSFNNIRIINSYEKGLSLSRNLAIKNAVGDICLIADDDVEYLSNFEQKILETFKKQLSVSIIQFKIETFSGKAYKFYNKVSKKLVRNKDFKKVSSIELAFKREHLINEKIQFNTLFGLGSYFKSGEEYLFLKEAFRKNLIIYFENSFIVKHKFERSTSNVSSNDFIKAKAAIYYKDYKYLSYLFLIKFIFFLYRKGFIDLKEFRQKYFIGFEAIKDCNKLCK